MDEIRLIAGLGNPGREYEGTRHNIGFEVIDRLAEKLGADVKQDKFGAAFGQTALEDKKLILLKPLKYMNNSGQAVATAVAELGEDAGLDKLIRDGLKRLAR